MTQRSVAAVGLIALGLAGALPFWISPQPELSLTDSIFESISGLTTTGATVILGLVNQELKQARNG
mgnify:CR=1 FL=1